MVSFLDRYFTAMVNVIKKHGGTIDKKGMDLYTQGIWNLAKEYFAKALAESKDDKAAKLMLSRCEEFIKNPPENWDGAIAFTTK